MQKYTQQIMIYDPLMFLCLCQFFSPLFLIFWNFCFALLSLQLFNGFLPFLFTHSDKQQTHNTLSCCLTGLVHAFRQTTDTQHTELLFNRPSPMSLRLGQCSPHNRTSGFNWSRFLTGQNQCSLCKY